MVGELAANGASRRGNCLTHEGHVLKKCATALQPRGPVLPSLCGAGRDGWLLERQLGRTRRRFRRESDPRRPFDVATLGVYFHL